VSIIQIFELWVVASLALSFAAGRYLRNRSNDDLIQFRG
jgi:hypothetical protein